MALGPFSHGYAPPAYAPVRDRVRTRRREALVCLALIVAGWLAFCPSVLGGTRPAPAWMRAVIAEMTGVDDRELFDPKATMPPVGAR
jgi:hypothetical protein